MIENIQLESGEIKITGKGNKQRIVLIGKSAIKAIKKYQDLERKGASGINYLFINNLGNPISVRSIQRISKL